jgi:RNA polymerase sigma factor (sigma-70 family)
MAGRPLTVALSRLRQALPWPDGVAVPDGELLDRFLTRQDDGAFEAIVRRHGPMVLGVCRRVLRNDADAEDAFQATFLVLVRKAHSVRSRGKVGNWLYGVAHNTALKAKAMSLRRRQKEREGGARPDPGAAADAGGELQDLLDRELSALPDKYRAPIVLCDLQGATLRDAARQLGCPQGTAATRLARGRALLARRLASRGLSLSGGAVALVLARSSTASGVPASLVVSTVQAAASVAAGPAAAAGVLSTRVAALTEGVVKAMLLTRLKALTAGVLAAALFGGGALLTYSTLRADSGGGGRESPPPAAPRDEKPGSDKDALQGTWVAVSGERDGDKLSEDAYWKLVFDGEAVTLVGPKKKDGGNEREGTFTLDADKKPKEINLTFGSLVLTGIYELKGTTLKTFWRENDRAGLAADFDSKKGGILMVFEKKGKAADKPQPPGGEDQKPEPEPKPKPKPDEEEEEDLRGPWKVVGVEEQGRTKVLTLELAPKSAVVAKTKAAGARLAKDDLLGTWKVVAREERGQTKQLTLKREPKSKAVASESEESAGTWRVVAVEERGPAKVLKLKRENP